VGIEKAIVPAAPGYVAPPSDFPHSDYEALFDRSVPVDIERFCSGDVRSYDAGFLDEFAALFDSDPAFAEDSDEPD
jgi:hypothetical protein